MGLARAPGTKRSLTVNVDSEYYCYSNFLRCYPRAKRRDEAYVNTNDLLLSSKQVNSLIVAK